MIEEKIARVKKLIEKREEIDAELSTIFGIGEPPRRGRPRKEARDSETGTPDPHQAAAGSRIAPESNDSDRRSE